MPEPLRGDESHLFRGAEDLRPAVGAPGGVVALPGYGTVEFPDPGGVVVRGIDCCAIVREEGVESRESALHERGRCLVVRKVDPVEEVGAVPGVCPDGFREPLLRKVSGDPARGGDGCIVLGVGRGDAARPDGVDIDREPAAADDVGIGRGRVSPGEAQLDPVRPPGEEGGVWGV
ncbi:hypothetical protein DSECCO2_607780 [anaerobic digester metagenome]